MFVNAEGLFLYRTVPSQLLKMFSCHIFKVDIKKKNSPVGDLDEASWKLKSLVWFLFASCSCHTSLSDGGLLSPYFRGSNSRALKIAGLTTLACLLLASQVFTAYMVFDQKQQIHNLQKNSERMGKQLTRSSHGKNKSSTVWMVVEELRIGSKEVYFKTNQQNENISCKSWWGTLLPLFQLWKTMKNNSW